MEEKYYMDMTGTRWDIFQAALDLFYTSGYPNVTMGQIATAVGISPGAIYHHFLNKDNILGQIYQYYQYCSSFLHPKISDLYDYLETHSVPETLRRIVCTYPADIQDRMSKIISIASSMPGDVRAQVLLQRTCFYYPTHYARSLLERMLELGRIEPIDIDSICLIYSCVCHSLALQVPGGEFKISYDLYTRILDQVFGIVQEIPQQKGRSQ